MTKLKPKEKESYLQSECNKLLRKHGILYYHAEAGRNPGMAMRRNSGYPDLFIFHEGKTIFIELKSKNGKLRPNQVEKIEQLKNAGYICYVAKDIKKFCYFIKLEYNIDMDTENGPAS